MPATMLDFVTGKLVHQDGEITAIVRERVTEEGQLKDDSNVIGALVIHYVAENGLRYGVK